MVHIESKIKIDLSQLPQYIGYHDPQGKIDIAIPEYEQVLDWIDNLINSALEVAPPEVKFVGWCPIGLAFVLGGRLSTYYLEGRIKSFSVTIMKNKINIPVCGIEGFVLSEKDFENHFSCQKDDLAINQIEETIPIGGSNQ